MVDLKKGWSNFVERMWRNKGVYAVVVKTGYLEEGAKSISKCLKKTTGTSWVNIPVCTGEPCKEHE